MVKYLYKKKGSDMSEENKMELEHLKKLLKKYENMEKKGNSNDDKSHGGTKYIEDFNKIEEADNENENENETENEKKTNKENEKKSVKEKENENDNEEGEFEEVEEEIEVTEEVEVDDEQKQ